jgi:CheY-like chemotaxis protein
VFTQRILVAEDKYLVAEDCAKELQEHGLDIIGPTGSLREALAAAKSTFLSGAMLDVDLRGQKIYRVADVLVDRNIPFVFYTGYLKTVLPGRFASISYFEKPSMQRAAISELLNRLKAGTSKLVPVVAQLLSSPDAAVSEQPLAPHTINRAAKYAQQNTVDPLSGVHAGINSRALLVRTYINRALSEAMHLH